MKVLPLNKEASGVLHFAISKDGKSVLSGMENKIAILWNLYNNQYLVFPHNTSMVNALALSPDGRKIAFQGDENSINLYSGDGTQVNTLSGHKESIRSIEFSRSGKYIVSAGEDNQIKIWDVETGRNLRTIKAHIDPITSVLFSQDEKLIFSAGEDGAVCIWNFSGTKIKEIKDHQGPVMKIALSNNGLIATAGDDGKIFIYSNDYTKKISIDAHSNTARSVVFSSDGSMLLSASEDRLVKLWKVDGKLLRTFKGHEDIVNLANFINSGKNILTASDDGTHRIFSLEGKELLDIAVTDQGKIVYSPNGKFDFDSEKLEDLLFFNPDGSELDLDMKIFYNNFYTPGLISLVLSGKISNSDSIQTVYTNSPPPVVEVKGEDSILNSDSVEIELEVCDLGGGIGEILLYQNNTLMQRENAKGISLLSKKNCIQQKIKTILIAGKNTFHAVATSKAGLSGYSKQLNLTYAKEDIKKPDLHLFVIGIDQYRDKSLNLNYAVKDGIAIRNKLLEVGKQNFTTIHTHQVFDSEADKKNILKTFSTQAKKMQKEDVAILFFSGHGISMQKNYYFISNNFSKTSPDFKKDAISNEELISAISEIPALKKLLIMDTCESGGEWSKGIEDNSYALSLGILSKTIGVTVISSSMEKQYAYEVASIGHGILTAALLEALDSKTNNGRITAAGLIPYVNKRVPELANLLLKKEQFPYTSFRGRDFTISE